LPARIRISDLNEPDSAAFFWPTPEDIVETLPTSLADVEAGKDLTAALERYLDDFFPTTDEHQRRCGACG